MAHLAVSQRTRTRTAAKVLAATAVVASCVALPATPQAFSAGTASGGSWSIVKTQNPTGSESADLLGVSCLTATDCEAVGNYEDSSGTELALAEVWDGTSWTIQSIPNPADSEATALQGVACVAGQCEAVGSYENTSTAILPLAELWDGTTWAAQTPPAPARLTAATLDAVSCPVADACEAIGYATSASSASTFADGWNGTKWKLQTTPKAPNDGSTAAVSCVTGSDCEASIGQQSGKTRGPRIVNMGWDGTTWAKQNNTPPQGIGNFMTDMQCISADYCEAIGYSLGGGIAPQFFAQVYDGSTWTIQSTTGITGGYDNYAGGLSCPSADYCEAVGSNSSSPPAPFVTQALNWNGTRWKNQPIPSPSGSTDSQLNDVSCVAPNQCEAVGYKTPSSGISVTLAYTRT